MWFIKIQGPKKLSPHGNNDIHVLFLNTIYLLFYPPYQYKYTHTLFTISHTFPSLSQENPPIKRKQWSAIPLPFYSSSPSHSSFFVVYLKIPDKHNHLPLHANQLHIQSFAVRSSQLSNPHRPALTTTASSRSNNARNKHKSSPKPSGITSPTRSNGPDSATRRPGLWPTAASWWSWTLTTYVRFLGSWRRLSRWRTNSWTESRVCWVGSSRISRLALTSLWIPRAALLLCCTSRCRMWLVCTVFRLGSWPTHWTGIWGGIRSEANGPRIGFWRTRTGFVNRSRLLSG